MFSYVKAPPKVIVFNYSLITHSCSAQQTTAVEGAQGTTSQAINDARNKKRGGR